MSDRPKIKVHIFEERHWISLDDHKSDIQRYKDAETTLRKTIERQEIIITTLKSTQTNKNTDPFGSVIDSLFGKR